MGEVVVRAPEIDPENGGIRNKADAILIAAAPELLEALKQIEDTRIGHWSDGEMRAIARAAIAKATAHKEGQ